MTDTTPPKPPRLRRLHARMHANAVTGLVTKIVVTFVGLAVIVAGVIMLIIPGPGLVAIALGLAILATEWHWARRATHWMTTKARSAAARTGADPAQRRRRLVGASLAALAVVATMAVYVGLEGWPRMAVRGWDWVQGLSGVVPDLPGM